MKIVIDDKIPYIREAIEDIADEVVYIPGKDISHADVVDANVLIVRTRTLCNRQLLEGSSVEFVATATIGFDHIDTEYMADAGIDWMNCPGCNSSSVEQYMRSVFILLHRDRGLDLHHSTLGVVGCGHVGSKVAAMAEELGMKVVINDPPREECGGQGEFFTLEEIAHRSDVVTFHVPMVRQGKFATYHLCDREFFDVLHRQPFLVNTSRGGVVNNDALLDALNGGKIKDAIIDTWENEPDINLALLNKVYIGTPHIAGYSADGKVNADNMVIDGLCRHFRIRNKYYIEPPSLPSDFWLPNDSDEAALKLYNPLKDNEMLKSHPEKFEWLRGNYPLRRERI